MAINSFQLNRKLFLKRIFVFFSFFGDIIFIVLSDLSAFTLRFGTDIYHPPLRNFLAYLNISIPILIIRLISFYIFGLYSNLRSKTIFEITVSTLKAVTSSSLIIIAVAFYLRAFAYPRLVIILSWLLTLSLCVIWRIFLRIAVAVIFGKEFLSSKIVIVGADREAQKLGLHITEDASIKYELIGYINPQEENPKTDFDSSKILGTLEELPKIAEEKKIDEVIFATRDIPREKLIHTLKELSFKNIEFKVTPEIYEAVMGNIICYPLDDMTQLFLSPMQKEFYWYVGFKRIFDLFFSIVILILSSPLILLTALLIKMTSKGPVFYKQERIGLYGRLFTLYKFRTMYEHSEDSGPIWASDSDKRVTGPGRFLRKTRLDELPQLYNVIRNEMSIVGPRPERPYYTEILMNEIPFYLERLKVKPGITGWAQVNCPYADSIEDSKEKFIHDIFYIKNMSFTLDLIILLKTIWTIIQEKGAH